MERIPEGIPFFAQSGESDWQTLVRLANEHGLVVVGTNTVIRIVDPSLETRRQYRRIGININVNRARSFTSSHSSTPVGFERRSFIGVDKFGETFEVTANPESPISLHAPELVSSLGAAMMSKDRLERRRHSRRTATATVESHPHARSGTCVNLSNGQDVRTWFVLEAKHMMKGDNSSTSLTLCRDDDDNRGAVAASGNQRWPQAVNVNAKWRSSTKWSREL
ncbi:MAG: hypothetical protein WKH64_12650 [Chloroflexia bacterium]